MPRFKLLTDEEIINSPSYKVNISTNDEKELRKSGITFIRNLCKLLDLYPFAFWIITPKVYYPWRCTKSYVIYTACVFFQRFYSIQTYKAHDRYVYFCNIRVNARLLLLDVVSCQQKWKRVSVNLKPLQNTSL